MITPDYLPSWKIFFDHSQDQLDRILSHLESEFFYPNEHLIFKAFQSCEWDDLKVVILGQDPYHGKGQADGLAFSVPNDIPITPSLRNIFRELHTDLGISRTCTDLRDWASQGILLLNSIMTVMPQKPLSHSHIGWQLWTDQLLNYISNEKENVVFILWGAYAQKKKSLIDNTKHMVIESTHPSPLSAHRGFIGSHPFSQVNAYLSNLGKEQITW